jgi:uncharacterized protein (TIGR00369 family)
MHAATPHPSSASQATAGVPAPAADGDPAAATLARWLADEAAIRARSAGPVGVLGPEHHAARAGKELFAAMLAGEAPRPPMGETLDFILVAAEPGKAVFQGRPQARFYNPMGTVHGGWYATLLDSALGCAVHAALPAGRAYTTLELKINLVRALTAAVPLVRAEAQVLHLGRQTATAEARLVGPDGRLYAHGTTTCLVFDLPPAQPPG